MSYFMATKHDQTRQKHVPRFRPDLWTVNFARPMMAAITMPASDVLRMDVNFLTKKDLAGLIWSSEDTVSHPLLAYATTRDYRAMTLSFDWVSGAGVTVLDDLDGATLTIEGREANGTPKIWLVRLWNYALGDPDDASIFLDFDNLWAGFAADEQVFAGDIDRMFINITPDQQDGTNTPLPQPVDSFVEFRNMQTAGLRASMLIGDTFLPPHGYSMCSGYDDSYDQAPERLAEQWIALGYRDFVNHYVGMSHYMALQHVGNNRYEVRGGLCSAARAWHDKLLLELANAGMRPILSLSFELLDEHAPPAWAQLDKDGGRALTGWVPPSTLLSPCNPTAMAWLQAIAAEFAALDAAYNPRVNFQVGEPWWWVGLTNGKPCFYDAATVSAWTAEKGTAPPIMGDVLGNRTQAEKEWLTWLGTKLASATAAVREAARAAVNRPFTSYMLFYAPQVLDNAAPDLRLANMPDEWSSPEWDVLQLEDYDFVIDADYAAQAAARAAVTQALGYPLEDQQYFSGFVLNAIDGPQLWPLIAEAAEGSRDRGTPAVYVWAWPQMARDGFTWMADGMDDPRLRAWHFSLDGHDFYVLRLGTDMTIVHDLTTGQWSWWHSPDRQNWRANYGFNWLSSGPNSADYGSNVFVGDDEEGVVWALDPEQAYDEKPAGGLEYFLRVATGQIATRTRRFLSVFQAYLMGSLGRPAYIGAEVKLEYSDDSGLTFKDAGDIEVRNLDRVQELAWRSLGRIYAPGRLFRVTDDGAVARIDSLDVLTDGEENG